MIRTIETDPEHSVIGNFFDAYDGKVYYCDSHDSRCGYWMTEYKNPVNRVNISERAIDRTFHTIHTDGMYGGTGFSQFRRHIKREDMPTGDAHMNISILSHARVLMDVQLSIEKQGTAVVELGTEDSRALLEARYFVHDDDLAKKVQAIVDDGHVILKKEDLDLVYRAKAALAEAGGQPLTWKTYAEYTEAHKKEELL